MTTGDDPLRGGTEVMVAAHAIVAAHARSGEPAESHPLTNLEVSHVLADLLQYTIMTVSAIVVAVILGLASGAAAAGPVRRSQRTAVHPQ